MADLKTKLTNMKVAELRSELGKLGLEKQGTKMVLVDRLLKHYESSTENGNETENGNDSQSGTEEVIIDEVVDTTTDEQEQEADDEQGKQEESVEKSEDIGNENGPESMEVEGQEEDALGDDEQDYGEEEETELQDGEPADAEVIVDTGDDEETEGDALNISVEENETLGDEQDDKAGNDDDINVEADDVTILGDKEDNKDDGDGSNNASTTGKFEADSDNKTSEGDTDSNNKGIEQERHIILVTGLSSDTSANDLKTFFRKYGKIGRIKIMTNTRVPGSQRFAHISVPSLDELNHLVDTLNGVELKGKSIRVAKAPEDGSVSRSYEIAVATAKAEADGGEVTKGASAENGKHDESGKDPTHKDSVKKDTPDNGKKESGEKKKDDRKEVSSTTDKKTPDKRPERSAGHHRSRKETHERPGDRHVRPHRPFRRDKDSTEWRRHGPPRGPMEVTRVHRDRPPMGRPPPAGSGGRRRSPHAAQLTFEQIRDIRDEQRRREHERRKREEERERAAESERQKRLEYQNYMEFKQLEKEREKLRLERERIEREKQELIKLERERQKAEREKIEREKEELRRAKMTISDHPRGGPIKRSFEDDKVRRREPEERKKPFVERGRPEAKTEAERKLERERFNRERLHSASHAADNRSRSPHRSSAGVARDSRRDVWARDDPRDTRPVGRVRTRSDERRDHRRETEAEKIAAAERRSREAPRGTVSSVDLLSRHSLDLGHSSSRGGEASKRPTDRYDDPRAAARSDGEWIQRSYLAPASSFSLPLGASSSASRESWPFTERKIEAWDTSRLTPKAEQWISGASAQVGTAGRSSLPGIAPPPPLYSSAAASLALQGSSLGLGGYASSADRYEGYRGGFHPLRKY